MPSATIGQSSQSDGSVELAQTSAANGHDEAVYSSFSTASKRCISFAASSAAMFSGLSSFVYYPAITPLAESLHTSVGLINLTITSYLIVSGFVPSIVGDLADRTGRRPLYILTFAIYFAANIGLALQDSYPALFVLRMLQSAGSSSLLAHVLHHGIGG
ncbi:MAG: hypothetical protein Q9193_000134 [Seirophora villosa]